MRISTFNVNSIRARSQIVIDFILQYSPDIVGLQETKVTNEDFPLTEFDSLSYQINFHGQKSYNGVAIFAKYPPLESIKGIDFEHNQARFIYNKFNTNKGKLHFLNCYFPQGESSKHPTKFPYKKMFYASFLKWLASNFDPQKDMLLVVGDFNIAPEDSDIGIGEQNKKRWLQTGKCSFLPEEIQWFKALENWGLKDPYRKFYPTSNEYFTWFDYRSKGFEDNPKRGLRIDYCICTPAIFELCSAVQIDYISRGKVKPSDHAPAVYDFELNLQ